MDDARFDRLTRRFVLGGLAGGGLAAILGFDEVESKKKKLSKRKRCRKKKRIFCAGRCCPRGRRCENGACFAVCANPGRCPNVEGDFCGGGEECFCTTSVTGASACIALPAEGTCLDLLACGAGNPPCPAGLICGTCSCLGADTVFRCFDPCPTG